MHEDALGPWVPVPPSILWDEEDLDLKQSLEAHCQTLQTLIRKMAKSKSPGSQETVSGATAIVGALWTTCFTLNICACLVSHWTSVKVRVTGHWARRTCERLSGSLSTQYVHFL